MINMPQGQFYPMCMIFNTLEDATLANEKLSNAMGQQWSNPVKRITDEKWWLEQPDYNEEYLKVIIGDDISYTLEEFSPSWRIQETS